MNALRDSLRSRRATARASIEVQLADVVVRGAARLGTKAVELPFFPSLFRGIGNLRTFLGLLSSQFFAASRKAAHVSLGLVGLKSASNLRPLNREVAYISHKGPAHSHWDPPEGP